MIMQQYYVTCIPFAHQRIRKVQSVVRYPVENIPCSGSQSGCHSGPSRYNNIASTVINGRIWFVSERRFDLVNSWYARCWRFEMVSRIPENRTRIVIVGTTVWISSSRWFWWCYFIVSYGSNSTTYWYIVMKYFDIKLS